QQAAARRLDRRGNLAQQARRRPGVGCRQRGRPSPQAPQQPPTVAYRPALPRHPAPPPTETFGPVAIEQRPEAAQGGPPAPSGDRGVPPPFLIRGSSLRTSCPAAAIAWRTTSAAVASAGSS